MNASGDVILREEGDLYFGQWKVHNESYIHLEGMYRSKQIIDVE